jgi:spore germination protein KC
MKKWFPVFVIAGLFLLSGYAGLGMLPPKTDITDYAIIQIMGIDKAEDGDLIVTLTSRHGVQSSETSVNTQVIEIMTGKGATVVQALGQIDLVANRIQQLGYLDFVLIGETAAKDSVVKCLDHITRIPQSNFQANVFVIRNSTAQELIEATLSETRLLSDTLKNMLITGKDYSTTTSLSLIELITKLDTPGVIAEIPAIKMITADGFHMKGGVEPDCGTVSDGYAIISDLKLAGYVEQPLSRALNLIQDTGAHSVVTILDEDGGYVSLYLSRSQQKMTPVIENGKVKTLKLDFLITSYTEEQSSNVALLSEETIARIEKKASELVAGEIGSLLNQMITFGHISFTLAEQIKMAKPAAFFDMENNFTAAVEGVTYDLYVRVLLRHQYDIEQPNGSEMFGVRRLIGTDGKTGTPDQSFVYKNPLPGEDAAQKEKEQEKEPQSGSGGEGGNS